MTYAFNKDEFKGITQDSRRVKEGYLFAALSGTRADGRKYISDAVKNGATAVLAKTGTVLPDGIDPEKVKLLTDDNPRLALAKIAADFYVRQPAHIVAITGTNGKTSTAHFVKQLWRANNLKAACIGTLGVHAPGISRQGAMTTPDPVSLHAELADLAASGVTHLAMEASSHGLDQYRLDGVKIKVAGFTNFSRDHLDYHEDMDHYLRSKRRLIRNLLQPDGTAVLNADIDQYDMLHEDAVQRGCETISYGLKGKDICLKNIQAHPGGQTVTVEIFGIKTEINLPLVGAFQVENALCALGLVLAENRKEIKTYTEALAHLQGVRGRLELVEGHPAGAAVYIDYAHTPDALESVLKALRPHVSGQLVCLFGCGGDRDAGKRVVMGKIASALADVVIVTDDNPRSEDPAEIRKEILAGAKGAQEIGDRREAVRKAVKNLKSGDVLVVAGKGHEQGQVFADHTQNFDDYEEAKHAIGALGKNEF